MPRGEGGGLRANTVKNVDDCFLKKLAFTETIASNCFSRPKKRFQSP
jgi:hypothetical protein